MLECEIKLLEIHKREVVESLTKIGAHCLGEKVIIDIYFDRELLGIAGIPMRTRIRFTTTGSILTCKFKLPGKNSKQAYELDHALPAGFMLQQAQRPLVDHMRIKKRTSWSWSGYLFDLDEYIGLPPLLEIEGPNEKSIQEVIQLLGLTTYNQSNRGAKSIYEAYDISLPVMEYGFFQRLISLIRSG